MLQLIDSLQTVLSTQNQHEVIATDMADEVHPRIDPFVQALRKAQQDLVTLGIAVKVVEGFEVVDIHIADQRLAPLQQQASQALLDRHVAR